MRQRPYTRASSNSWMYSASVHEPTRLRTSTTALSPLSAIGTMTDSPGEKKGISAQHEPVPLDAGHEMAPDELCVLRLDLVGVGVGRRRWTGPTHARTLHPPLVPLVVVVNERLYTGGGGLRLGRDQHRRTEQQQGQNGASTHRWLADRRTTDRGPTGTRDRGAPADRFRSSRRPRRSRCRAPSAAGSTPRVDHGPR